MSVSSYLRLCGALVCNGLRMAGAVLVSLSAGSRVDRVTGAADRAVKGCAKGGGGGSRSIEGTPLLIYECVERILLGKGPLCRGGKDGECLRSCI